MNLATKILEYRPRLKKLYKLSTNDLKSVELEIRDEKGKLVKFLTGVINVMSIKLLLCVDFFSFRLFLCTQRDVSRSLSTELTIS